MTNELELEEIIAFSYDEKDRRKKYYYLTEITKLWMFKRDSSPGGN